MNRQKESEDAIAAEMARAGITDYEFRQGGKHPRVVFTTASGTEQMLVYSKTPSDRHAQQNNIGQLRRMLGFDTPKPAKSSRRTPAKRARRETVPTLGAITVRPDPFACLALWMPPKPKYPVTWTRISGRSWRVEVRCQGESE